MENNDTENKIEEGGIKKYIPFVLEIAKIAIIAFVIVAPIRYFLFQPFIVQGESMHPNFNPGDYLIVDEITYRMSEPQRGDVVVFNTNFIQGYANQRFIKRIVGLPGEKVNITDGEVQIMKDSNTIVLEEKYIPQDLKTYTYGETSFTLGENEYFVLGDNRDYSYDSRMWGFVHKKDIVGRALLRLWPITNISGIKRPLYE